MMMIYCANLYPAARPYNGRLKFTCHDQLVEVTTVGGSTGGGVTTTIFLLRPRLGSADPCRLGLVPADDGRPEAVVMVTRPAAV